MTNHMPDHMLRKWLKLLKRHFQLNRLSRERGYEVRLDPARLPL